MTVTRKIFTATIAALSLGAIVAATTTPAAAEHGFNGALFGGLAAGALLGGAIAANSGPSYYAAPAYVEGSCYMSRQPVVNRWGDVVGYRRVRVCD